MHFSEHDHTTVCLLSLARGLDCSWLSCSLKQECWSERTPARRWADHFTRRPTDVQCHHAG